MKKVVLGLSGGVDSSVAAYLLQKQGYEVIGLFMINWKDSSVTLSGDCTWEEDLIVAKLVAKKLNIHLEVVDSSEDYKQKVVDYLFDEYEKGRTPNPDVLCNREIKFDVFEKYAKQFGADYVATGHYAKIDELVLEGKTLKRLLIADDLNKDQSYFLCQLSQDQLKNVLFPLGNIDKPEVRRIAKEIELATAERKDSQGICFIGKVDLPTFLQQKLAAKTGKVIEIDENDDYFRNLNFSDLEKNIEEICKPYNFEKTKGKVIGEHRGAHFYTIGQRKGLNIGGKQKPLFVLATDVEKNIIYVGQGHDHPGLNRKGLFINKAEIHWIRPDLTLKIGEKKECWVRIRYRQKLQKASLFMRKEGMFIVFEQMQRGITSGQFATWYYDDELVGSGVIA